MSGLIEIIVVLIIVGLIVWLVETYLPIPPVFKHVIVALIVLVLILWLLSLIGFLGSHPAPILPR
jgi:hypothetical protein